MLPSLCSLVDSVLFFSMADVFRIRSLIDLGIDEAPDLSFAEKRQRKITGAEQGTQQQRTTAAASRWLTLAHRSEPRRGVRHQSRDVPPPNATAVL